MTLSDHLNSFITLNKPSLKLSYTTYKKVCTNTAIDSFRIIPSGKKVIICFTRGKCFIIDGFQTENTVFHSFSYISTTNTVLYGTLFYVKDCPFVSIDDVIMYNNKFVLNTTYWTDKLKIMDIIIESVAAAATEKQIVFGTPIIVFTENDIRAKLNNNVKHMYKIQCIQLITSSLSHCVMSCEYYKNCLTSHNPYHMPAMETLGKMSKQTKEKIFTVIADMQHADTYYVYNYFYNTKKVLVKELVGNANIPNYKTSVMMNALFNKPTLLLDKIEESDDEDECTGTGTGAKMLCTFDYKFKLWTPMKQIT